jgi:glutamate synthase (NADPH/NADH) small chain
LDYGHEEAHFLYGKDPRAFSILSKAFLGDENGNVRAVRTVYLDAGNGASAREPAGTERDWPAQMVLLALGFLGPETGLLSQLGVALNDRGIVAVDQHMTTNVPKIFSAGDMARGQSLVVWAIADGRRAARGIDRFLMGETSLP